MTSKQKKLIRLILWICIVAVGIKIVYSFINSGTIDSYGLFTISIFIASLLEMHTFGRMTYLGGNNDKQKDELEDHIVKVSSKISYFSLMIIVLLIMAVTEYLDGSGDTINTPLMLVFCATIITLPLVQLVISKNYK